MKYIKIIFISAVILFTTISNLFSISLQEYVANPKKFGNIILVRHAYAPGYGDPAHFKIGDCTTQRNLDEKGIAQAKSLGQVFRDHDFEFEEVYSSQWCRCLDTAKHMDVGEVIPFKGLNSFFQGLVDKGKTMTALRGFLEEVDNDKIYLLVTHFVVIGELTGLTVDSGGAVAYHHSTGEAVEIELD